jgi:hypothetical protein
MYIELGMKHIVIQHMIIKVSPVQQSHRALPTFKERENFCNGRRKEEKEEGKNLIISPLHYKIKYILILKR